MKPIRSALTITVIFLGLMLSKTASAFEIVIDEGVENALPIAIVPFGWNQSAAMPPTDVAEVIRQDLARSGHFNALPPADMPAKPTSFDAINFADWRRLGMEHVVVGELKQRDDGGFEVSFRLVDVYRGSQVAGYSIRTRKEQLRYTAHQVADIIYEELTGNRGAFATRIAYITVNKKNDKKVHKLEIADADGHGAQVLLTSPEPLMSPRWSPDGRRLAYVSFEGRNSAVYIQNVYSGQRKEVASHSGINSAPAWSPDGNKLAMTLSKDGSPDIYVMDIDSDRLQRVTNSSSIDTEAAWSADGDMLYFTSDRGGSPQIYKVAASGGTPKRVTFDGGYNARPALSPDGEKLAMVRGGDGYRIAVQDLDSGRSQVLTDGSLDESPSFAPNSGMIIYATTVGESGALAAVSVDGQVKQKLEATRGDVREPDWGPFQD
ncbi:TolB protein [Methylohalomonas lacus]|uniref:Tol-Pal system protein TolB n=1 Tax=Methylohalomonas lacus TaxID=398773 RepID=A0AAE3HLW7_9GAMM|nr:Tol-Pal system beta propeller repeat protein TolB [Methylohalomonas lacus]MCS3904190.1 TolB protein [Methylohalomonas lacus]